MALSMEVFKEQSPFVDPVLLLFNFAETLVVLFVFIVDTDTNKAQ